MIRGTVTITMQASDNSEAMSLVSRRGVRRDTTDSMRGVLLCPVCLHIFPHSPKCLNVANSSHTNSLHLGAEEVRLGMGGASGEAPLSFCATADQGYDAPRWLHVMNAKKERG